MITYPNEIRSVPLMEIPVWNQNISSRISTIFWQLIWYKYLKRKTEESWSEVVIGITHADKIILIMRHELRLSNHDHKSVSMTDLSCGRGGRKASYFNLQMWRLHKYYCSFFDFHYFHVKICYSIFRYKISWLWTNRIRNMPRIDPAQLLQTLSVLLGPSGGIKSTEEVTK